MEKVRACAQALRPLFVAVFSGDDAERDRRVGEICRLETEADEVKNEIRAHLPVSMFLPIDRRDLLEMLTLQDMAADVCRDVAVSLTLRKMAIAGAGELTESVGRLVEGVEGMCTGVADVIQELDELVETTFGGQAAAKVLGMLEKISADETVVDGVAIDASRALFALEGTLGAVDVIFWYRILRRLGDLAHLAEGVANRIRLLLAR